jgi:hypothetical protein
MDTFSYRSLSRPSELAEQPGRVRPARLLPASKNNVGAPKALVSHVRRDIVKLRRTPESSPGYQARLSKPRGRSRPPE